MNKKYLIIIFLILIFIFRLLFSLTTEFWWQDEDVFQIYLIGLKFFTTGEFPLFGPDLVYNNSQIPGGLQGILVSVLWFIIKIPEAPHIFLNIIIFISLLFLSYYIKLRLKNISSIIIYLFILFIPLSVCYLTKIINPSYLIPGAVLFFIGIFELIPSLRIGAFNQKIAFYFTGIGLLWVYQLHMSWVLMLPYLFFVLITNFRENSFKNFSKNLLFFILGTFTTGITLLPTIIYSLSMPSATLGTLGVIQFKPEHLLDILNYLSVYLSHACFNVTVYIGGSTPERLEFLKNYYWAAPSVILVGIAGVLQAVLLVIMFFYKKNNTVNWRAVKLIVLSGIVFYWLSSMFSITKPFIHSTIILFPLIAIYNLHALEPLFAKNKIRFAIYILFVLSGILYIAISHKNFYNVSLYKNREVIVKTLNENNYKILGLRRYEKKNSIETIKPYQTPLKERQKSQ